MIINRDEAKTLVKHICSGRVKTAISNLCTSTQIMYTK